MLDIDGTLAPIAPTPQAAAIPDATRQLIRRLMTLDRTMVALITGRSVADAWTLAAMPGVWIIGNHGFELRAPDGTVTPVVAARPFESAIESATQALIPLQREMPGVLIENKRWTLAVHYRLVSDVHALRVIERAREVAAALGLRPSTGKKIIELRPPVNVDKGTAALEFVARAGAQERAASTFYAGDDRTDEDAFRALRGTHPGSITVRLADDDSGVDGTSAEFVIGTTDALRQILEWFFERRTAAKARDA